MKQQKITVSICLGIYAAIAIGTAIMEHRETMASIGLFGLLLGVFYLLVGLVLCIPKESRSVGKAILLCAGIAFIIGVGVCSFFPFRFGR
jgi:hypothetical protein